MAGVLETFTVPRATTFPAAAATSAPIRTSSVRSLLRSRRSVEIQSSYATSSRGLVTRRLGHRRGNRIVCEAQNTAIEGNPGGFHKYRHLWVQCDVCYGLNYKPHFNSQMYICESCEYHVEMNSSDRIDLLIDPNTWVPMDEDMVSRAIEWDFEEKEEPFKLDLSEWEAELKKVSTELELRIQLKKEKEKADRERIDSEEDDQTYQEHLDFEDKGKTDQDLLSLEEDRCDSEKMGEFRYDLQGRREE